MNSDYFDDAGVSGDVTTDACLRLRAGPLELDFEPASGFLRRVRFGRYEVLRGVYVAVRDQNWKTVAPAISNLVIDRRADSFALSFHAECRLDPIDFAWDGRLTGDASGMLLYTMEGRARSTFLRNRIGFCVLHPIVPCAGRRCVVEKTDGRREEGEFPQWISPQTPWKDMRAIRHEVVSGMFAEVRMEGDVFEMEDQRNWSDASFKTYCTPEELPFPVEVPAGTQIYQKVTLQLHGAATHSAAAPVAIAPHQPIALRLGAAVELPRLGLGMASHGRPLGEREVARLRDVRPDYLRVDLRLSSSDFIATLHRAAEQARAIGCGLHAAVFLGDDAEEELRRLAHEVRNCSAPVTTWLVFHVKEKATSARWVALARRVLQSCAAGARVAMGTDCFFAELNRNRPPAGAGDLVCYSMNPQVHAADNDSIVETLEAQADMVRTARRFTDGAPILVSPITLRARFNPDATAEDAPPAAGELPPQVDSRQASLLAAAWTLGSIARLAEAGVHSATYFETTGWRGIMETAAGTPPEYHFPSSPGCVFPLYHLLADLADGRHGAIVHAIESDEPLVACGLAFRHAAGASLLIANLSGMSRHVRLPADLRGCRLVRILDETNVARVMTSPEQFRAERGDLMTGERLSLRPYALARVDIFRRVGNKPMARGILSDGMGVSQDGPAPRNSIFTNGGDSMKKLGLLVLMVCVGLFATGCPQQPKAKPKSNTETPPAKVAPHDAAAEDAKAKAAEAAKAEEQKKIEAAQAEEERKAAEAAKAEEEKKAAAAKAEEERKAAEAAKAEEEKKAAEAKAEEERKAAEAAKAEEEKEAAAAKAEEERKAAEAAKAEEEKKAADEKKPEEK